MGPSCGIVVSAAGWVGEGVVGVVYELEFSGSLRAFWGICWDAVGVGSKCCSVELLVRESKFGMK